MKTGGLVNVKSYLTMECNGEKRAIYCISGVENTAASFRFSLPEGAQKVRWHMVTDFSIQVRNLKITSADAICTDCLSMADDGRSVIADIPGAESMVTVQCDVLTLTPQQREDLYRREYGNRLAHIELLLETERTLQAKLANLENQYQLAQKTIQHLEEEGQTLKSHYDQMVSENQAIIQRLEEEEQTLKSHYDQVVSENQATIQRLEEEGQTLKSHYDQVISENQATIQRLEEEGQTLKSHYDRVISEKNAIQHTLEQAYLENNQSAEPLTKLRQEMEKAEQGLVQLRQEKEQAEAHLSSLRQENEIAWDKIFQMKNEQIRFQSEIEELKKEKENTWGEVLQLRDKENRYLNEIAAIKASRSWRLGQFIAKFVRKFVPVGSKRAVFFRLLVTMIKHPQKFFSCLRPEKIKKFFRLLRRGNTESIQNLIRMNITGQCAPPQLEVLVPEVVPVTVPEEGQQKTTQDYPVLMVPKWDNPTVSIIIPVYNQFEYTYHCVESIVKNSGEITYEILIGNDCSTDLTTQIETILPGVRCITNDTNLRFVRNCKRAAQFARGTYVLFLNNDTQVQSNWLEPLVSLIESADDIGMVGSKLVYPDGTLQEAGGILWRDGSAWNYGNRQNPALPEFNYVKEADYISGASIMLSRSLWEKIGGFDETFAPAYCDDSDLAFTVRKLGYRVMYQPKSVVVHFEGVSNGTDTSSGQKRYQVVNMKKFYEKWKDVLEAEHFENGQNVFQARDRSRKKKTVLVVDHYIPTYDKDAGSRSMDHYIKLLVDLGFNVKFIGDNFYHDTQYAPRYEQWGVEILYGVYYRDHWREWIKENGKHLDFVLLSRPHISIKYIDILREYTQAKIVYYVQDLHFLREEREYEITKDPERLISAKTVKKQEMDIMGKSDVVFTLSDVEKTIIDQAFQPGKAVVTPISYYSAFPETPVDLAGKSGIIFVGGFGHHPNEDGVLWFFNEVWDAVSKALPECKVTIIGSKPTKRIQALASERVTVTGFISDEELEEYYCKSRLCIIPLRYGAGVKGKTVEAMYHRIPLVSTSVGIEGLEGVQEYIQPADDAEAFAQRVIKLYTDDALAAVRAEGYCQYLKEHNSYQSALALFADVFRKGE